MRNRQRRTAAGASASLRRSAASLAALRAPARCNAPRRASLRAPVTPHSVAGERTATHRDARRPRLATPGAPESSRGKLAHHPLPAHPLARRQGVASRARRAGGIRRRRGDRTGRARPAEEGRGIDADVGDRCRRPAGSHAGLPGDASRRDPCRFKARVRDRNPRHCSGSGSRRLQRAGLRERRLPRALRRDARPARAAFVSRRGCSRGAPRPFPCRSGRIPPCTLRSPVPPATSTSS